MVLLFRQSPFVKLALCIAMALSSYSYAADSLAADNILETVIINANKYKENLSKTPGSVAVITDEEMKQKGATELYDTLNDEPGVAVTGGAGRQQNIVIRGVTGNRISIIKDGVSTSEGYGALDINDKAGRDSFDLSTLKKIEVVKGGSSTIYGSGAIGGVVLLKSKTPSDFLKDRDFYAGLDLNYMGASGQVKSSGVVALRTSVVDHLFSLSILKSSGTKNFQDDIYPREVLGANVDYALDYYLGENLYFNIRLGAYMNRMKRTDGIVGAQEDGNWKAQDFYQQYDKTHYKAQVSADYDAESSLADTIKIKGYFRTGKNKDYQNILMAALVDRNTGEVDQKTRKKTIENSQFRTNLVGLSSTLNKAFQIANIENSLVYGLRAETKSHERPRHKKTYKPDGTIENKNTHAFARARSTSLGLFGQDKASLGPFSLALGLRFDVNHLKAKQEGDIEYSGGLKDNTTYAFSPSVSLGYDVLDNLNLYGSYKRGYRAPGYDKVYGYVNHDFIPITPFIIIPNFDLKAETSNGYEVGAKYDNGSYRIYTSYFYTKFHDFVDVATIATKGNKKTEVATKQYTNLESASSHGVDVMLAYALSKDWELSAKGGIVNGKDSEGRYLRTLSPLEGNVKASYKDNGLKFYSQVNWAAAMKKAPKTCQDQLGSNDFIACATTKGWTSTNVGLGYDISSNSTINVNVYNLFNKKYIRYQSVAGSHSRDTGYAAQASRYITLFLHYNL